MRLIYVLCIPLYEELKNKVPEQLSYSDSNYISVGIMILREFERPKASNLRINIRGYAVSKIRVTGSCDLVAG